MVQCEVILQLTTPNPVLVHVLGWMLLGSLIFGYCRQITDHYFVERSKMIYQFIISSPLQFAKWIPLIMDVY